ncbi:PKD domain-containing protein [uncultured Duncaniella sp.]|uniref:PKD domain-containing protein n=1 Tax=uncultured Duncaniella sp. TaxID=2768039 RepID=UPI002730F2ED|nr:PKD domain-containing protein [uncultured Duncaniella sp.]
MKRNIFIPLFATLLLCACDEEHVMYETAAKPGMTIDGSSYEVGQPIKFSDNSVPTKGTTIKSYHWEFGDADKSTSDEAAPTFTYYKDGTYIVKLTVTDSNALSATTQQNVVVINPTKADFSFDEEEYLMGDVVTFTDLSVSKAPTTIKSWHWNFADEAGSTSEERNPKFKYDVPGSYPVTLTVTDSYGLKASITRSVNVLDPAMLVNPRWTAVLGGGVKGGSSPALSTDGSALYMLRSLAGEDKAALVAYNTADGQMAWTLDLSEAMANNGASATAQAKDVFSSPSVGADGTVYVVLRDLQSTTAQRGLYTLAVKPDGNVKWCTKVGASGNNLYAITPGIDANGNIYVAHRTKEIHKLSPSGTDTKFTGFGDITAGVTLSNNGTVFAVGKGNVGIFAVDANSGTNKWIYNSDFGGASDAFTGAMRSATPSVGADGTIYMVIDKGAGGAVVALDANGAAKWVYDTNGAIPDGGVAVAEDGTLYANGGTDPSTGLIALDPNGNLLWTFATVANVQTSPVIDNRGYVHVVDAMANYYVVRPDGTLFGQTKLGMSCISAPVMDAQGRLYTVVNKDGVQTVVCATSKASGYSTSSPWPMRGQNPQRTGLQKK